MVPLHVPARFPTSEIGLAGGRVAQPPKTTRQAAIALIRFTVSRVSIGVSLFRGPSAPGHLRQPREPHPSRAPHHASSATMFQRALPCYVVALDAMATSARIIRFWR